MLSKIDECQTGSEVANSVNVLTAIRWISLAWDQIQEETICKCFKKAGILSEDGAVVSRLEFEEDPFGDLELEGADDLSCLVDQIGGEHCSVDEYIEGDDDLGFCFDVEDENWDDEFFTNLVSAQLCNHETEELESDVEEECDVLPPEPKLKSIRQAIESLEDVQYFLQYHGHPNDPSKLSSVIDHLAHIQSKKRIQTSMDDFIY